MSFRLNIGDLAEDACTYDNHGEQNEAPDGRIEWLKDTERVWQVDGDGRSPDDDGQSEMVERPDEVDDLITCRCNRYGAGCHVCSVALISLQSNERHTAIYMGV